MKNIPQMILITVWLATWVVSFALLLYMTFNVSTLDETLTVLVKALAMFGVGSGALVGAVILE